MGRKHYHFTLDPYKTMEVMFREMPGMDDPISAYEYAKIFFTRVATAIARYGNKFKLEWVAGDVYTSCLQISTSSEARIAKNFPVQYDRIYLSNIPYEIYLFVFGINSLQ